MAYWIYTEILVVRKKKKKKNTWNFHMKRCINTIFALPVFNTLCRVQGHWCWSFCLNGWVSQGIFPNLYLFSDKINFWRVQSPLENIVRNFIWAYCNWFHNTMLRRRGNMFYSKTFSSHLNLTNWKYMVI